MRIIQTCNDIISFVKDTKRQSQTIGFVPTMGALHQGHLALLKQAKAENDVVICSIFVNPTQFNDAEDYKKYPRNIEKDIDSIKTLCDVVFVPSVEEMYPAISNKMYDLEGLDKVMEGKYRPGHFNGVVMIVDRFFEIISADYAYFGKKDFQQVVIIKKLVKIYKHTVQIVTVDTVREEDGLAFSSRNVLLSAEKRKEAPLIYQILLQAKSMAYKLSPHDIHKWIVEEFAKNNSFKLEYAAIVDALSLKEIKDFKESQEAVLCIAAYLDNVRLIDNLELYKK
ncbi:MAG: pantoate--beta-alanine ligase [Bacteroidales bacterium]|nr:pantoate--beta-alanine ligase [Bacteroidales bacterium]